MSDGSSFSLPAISTASSDHINSVYKSAQESVLQRKKAEENLQWRLEQGEYCKEVHTEKWHKSKRKKKTSDKLEFQNNTCNHKSKKIITYKQESNQTCITKEVNKKSGGTGFVASYFSILKGIQASSVTVEVRSDGSVIAEKKKNMIRDNTERSILAPCLQRCHEIGKGIYCGTNEMNRLTSSWENGSKFALQSFSGNMLSAPCYGGSKYSSDAKCNHTQHPPLREPLTRGSTSIHSAVPHPKVTLHKNSSISQRSSFKNPPKQVYRNTQSYANANTVIAKHANAKSYVKSNPSNVLGRSFSFPQNGNGRLQSQRGTNRSYPKNRSVTSLPDPRILCPNIGLYGYCSYGPECQFSHSVEQVECNGLLYDLNSCRKVPKESSLSLNRQYDRKNVSVPRNVPNLSSLMPPISSSGTQCLTSEMSNRNFATTVSCDTVNQNYFDTCENGSMRQNNFSREQSPRVPPLPVPNNRRLCMRNGGLSSFQTPPPPYSQITPRHYSSAVGCGLNGQEDVADLLSDCSVAKQKFILAEPSTIISVSTSKQETVETIDSLEGKSSEEYVASQKVTQLDLLGKTKASRRTHDVPEEIFLDLADSCRLSPTSNLGISPSTYSTTTSGLIGLKNNLTCSCIEKSFGSSGSIISEISTTFCSDSFTTASPSFTSSPSVLSFTSLPSCSCMAAFIEASTPIINSSAKQSLSCSMSTSSTLPASSVNFDSSMRSTSISTNVSTAGVPVLSVSVTSVSPKTNGSAVPALLVSSTLCPAISISLASHSSITFPAPPAPILQPPAPPSSLIYEVPREPPTISTSAILPAPPAISTNTSSSATTHSSSTITCVPISRVNRYSQMRKAHYSSSGIVCCSINETNRPSSSMATRSNVIARSLLGAPQSSAPTSTCSSPRETICNAPIELICSSSSSASILPSTVAPLDSFSVQTTSALVNILTAASATISACNESSTSVSIPSAAPTCVASSASVYSNSSLFAPFIPAYSSLVPSALSPIVDASTSAAYFIQSVSSASFASNRNAASISPTYIPYPTALASMPVLTSEGAYVRSFNSHESTGSHMQSEAPGLLSYPIPAVFPYVNDVPLTYSSGPKQTAEYYSINVTHSSTPTSSGSFSITPTEQSLIHSRITLQKQGSCTSVETPIASQKGPMSSSLFMIFPSSAPRTYNHDNVTTNNYVDAYYNHPALSKYSSFFQSVLTLSYIQWDSSPENPIASTIGIQPESIAPCLAPSSISNTSDESSTSLYEQSNPVSTFLNLFSAVQDDPVAAEKLIFKVRSSLSGVAKELLVQTSSLLPASYESSHTSSKLLLLPGYGLPLQVAPTFSVQAASGFFYESSPCFTAQGESQLSLQAASFFSTESNSGLSTPISCDTMPASPVKRNASIDSSRNFTTQSFSLSTPRVTHTTPRSLNTVLLAAFSALTPQNNLPGMRHNVNGVVSVSCPTEYSRPIF